MKITDHITKTRKKIRFLKAYDYSNYNWENSVTLDISVWQSLRFPVISQAEENKITSYFNIPLLWKMRQATCVLPSTDVPKARGKC